jgi:hypothetical protein
MRFREWPQLLEDYVQSRMAEPFAWGHHDCCRFAAGAVLAITGEDRMPEYHYASELAAAKLIRAAGSLEALVRRALGDPLASVALARRGDVLLAEFERGETVGVCLGDRSAFAAEVGLVHRPTLSCRLAWRIS